MFHFYANKKVREVLRPVLVIFQEGGDEFGEIYTDFARRGEEETFREDG